MDIIDAIAGKKRVRLVGDNINWRTDVHDQRQDHRGHMHHAFGSAAIIQTLDFSHLSGLAPQLHHAHAPVEMFLPNVGDWVQIAAEYAILIGRVAVRHIPAFHFLKDVVSKPILGQVQNKVKSKVIPLPVLHLNEQRYDDVVQILDYYESLMTECAEAAGEDVENLRVHIGGDQLTRERFSGAKCLRSGGITRKEQFAHLTPITFELFHLLMNYVKLMFKQLYKSDSAMDMGTMKCEENRILRTNVNENVNDHYDADKDFIISFVDAYIVTAVVEFFGMEDVHSAPTVNCPPQQWPSEYEKRVWMTRVFGQLVDRMVWASAGHRDSEIVVDDGMDFTVKQANGTIKTITMRKQKPAPDRVQNYGHTVLELGLMYKSLNDLCKIPDRDCGLRLLKVAMMHFKANNHMSKYAYECMRFLVHQTCVLSERAANEAFYGLFVNTRGQVDSHIPCDLQMEYIVQMVKKNIKHMFSNKSDKNITARTSVLPSVMDISGNYDDVSGVLVRAKKHSDKDANKDEMDMIKNLIVVKPFRPQPGRAHRYFPDIAPNLLHTLDMTEFRSWVVWKKHHFATELGR
jgi:hypothetical protein